MSVVTDLIRVLRGAYAAVTRTVSALVEPVIEPLMRRRREREQLARRISAVVEQFRQEEDLETGPDIGVAERTIAPVQPDAAGPFEGVAEAQTAFVHRGPTQARPWRRAGAGRSEPGALAVTLESIQIESRRLGGRVVTSRFRKAGGRTDGRLNHRQLVADLGLKRALVVAEHYHEVVDANPWLLLLRPQDAFLHQQFLGIFTERGWLER